MNKLNKYIPVLSMLLVILGLLLFLFISSHVGLYVYITGVVILGVVRFLAFIRSRNSKEISRLPQIHLLSAIFLAGAAYLIYDGSNSWSVLILASAVLEIYVSYRQK